MHAQKAANIKKIEPITRTRAGTSETLTMATSSNPLSPVQLLVTGKFLKLVNLIFYMILFLNENKNKLISVECQSYNESEAIFENALV